MNEHFQKFVTHVGVSDAYHLVIGTDPAALVSAIDLLPLDGR